MANRWKLAIGPGRCRDGDRSRSASIGRDCEFYPNVTIYPGARIGDRVIVHAGAVLGSDGFGYVRDPATGHYEKFPQIGRLEIGDDVEIGANQPLTAERWRLPASGAAPRSTTWFTSATIAR